VIPYGRRRSVALRRVPMKSCTVHLLPLTLYVWFASAQLTFFSMSLRDNDPCNDTYVDVLNGYMASSPSVGRYCRISTRQVRSQTNHLRIVYHTNSSVARQNRFRIMYRVQSPGRQAILTAIDVTRNLS